MASPVTGVTQTEPATTQATQTQPPAAKATATEKPTQSQTATASNLPNDTVKISSAAQTAVQEALETQATTLKEAAKGDPQAARLLAQEAATQQRLKE